MPRKKILVPQTPGSLSVADPVDALGDDDSGVVAAPTTIVDGRPGLGDRHTYAHLHASKVDQAKLSGPVLTLDGWLLPRPSATPE